MVKWSVVNNRSPLAIHHSPSFIQPSIIHMYSFEVTGGKTLKGDIIPQGAKNEALQVISCGSVNSGKSLPLPIFPISLM